MGSCLSTILNKGVNSNDSQNGYYLTTPEQKRIFERKYTSYISTDSSFGILSTCTSISSRNNLNRISPPSANSDHNIRKPKTHSLTFIRRSLSNIFEKKIIHGDLKKVIKVEQQHENKSFGYYSESILCESTISTPINSRLKLTHNNCLILESPRNDKTRYPNNLEMEMCMISNSSRLMPKTSSPIFHRKNITSDSIPISFSSSYSYHKWASYLQNTPTYLLHNVTDIPEAIAGQFSPLNFPAFTDFEEIENTSKSLKTDIHDINENVENQLSYDRPTCKLSNETPTATTDL